MMEGMILPFCFDLVCFKAGPMLDSETEHELVVQAQNGDEVALERLLLDSYDRLSRRLARKLPATLRGSISEEDILQQAFVSAFQSLDTFKPQGEHAFFRWLCTIAEHRLQDAIKAHRALKRGGGQVTGQGAGPGFEESVQQMIELLVSPKHTPSHSVARHEAAGAVERCLTDLKDDYRQALELRYRQGLPVAEIAQVMDKTPSAVHNLCHRGLRELYAAMGESTQYLSRF